MVGEKKGCPQCNEIPSAAALTCEYCGYQLATPTGAAEERSADWQSASALSRIGAFILDRLAMIPMVLTIIGPFIYLFWKDCFWKGRSLGKQCGGMKVIDSITADPCTGGQSVVRNLTLMIPLVNLIEMVFVLIGVPRLGDRLAGTRVVQDRGKPNASLAMVIGIIGLFAFVGVFAVGVLAAIAVPNFAAARERANTRACFANQKTIAGAVEMYRLDKGESAVDETQELSHRVFESLKAGHYLMSIPTDPGQGLSTDGHYYFTDVSKATVACRVHGSFDGRVNGSRRLRR